MKIRTSLTLFLKWFCLNKFIRMQNCEINRKIVLIFRATYYYVVWCNFFFFFFLKKREKINGFSSIERISISYGRGRKVICLSAVEIEIRGAQNHLIAQTSPGRRALGTNKWDLINNQGYWKVSELPILATTQGFLLS